MEKKKHTYIIWIAAGIAFIPTAIFVIALIIYSLPDNKSKGTSTPVPKQQSLVMITDWTNRPSSGGGYQYIEGVVKNMGNVTVKNIEITVKAIGENDKLTGIDKGYADPYVLPPGGEGTFKIMMDRIPGTVKYYVFPNWED